MWHLTLYTLHRRAGNDAGPLPGLWVGKAPKNAARLRRSETLLLYLVQQGSAPLPPEQVDKLLGGVAKRYFRQGGSATRALQAAVGDLNAWLVRRNQRLSTEGRRAVFWLAMAVWRPQRVLLGLSGPLHAYFLGPEVVHVHDPVLAGMGLGAQQGPRIHFATAQAVPHGFLLLASEPLGEHLEALRFPPARRPDPLLRRLLADPRPDLTAVLVQMRPGPGEDRIRPVPARWLMEPTEVQEAPGEGQPVVAPLGSAEEGPSAEQASALLESEVAREESESPGGEHLSEAPPPEPVSPVGNEGVAESSSAAPATAPLPGKPAPSVEVSQAVPSGPAFAEASGAGSSALPPSSTLQAGGPQGPRQTPGRPPGSAGARGGAGASPVPRAARVRRRFPWREKAAMALDGLSTVASQARRMAGGVLRPVGRVLRRALPAAEEWVALPRSMMAFAAVAVPLVIVAFAVTVFLRRGRMEQMAYHYASAQRYYQQALLSEDKAFRHQALAAAKSELELALTFGQAEEVLALEDQVRQMLDEMDRIKRVPFEPLVNGAPLQGRNILRLEGSPEALYALDGVTGAVMGFRRVVRGYDYRADFRCGPGKFTGVTVGPLVDFVLVDPTLGKDYTVLGIDGQAHVIFCATKGEAYARALPLNTTLPTGRRLLRLLGSDLYLLDPAGGALYVFSAQEDFSGQPYNLFAGFEPLWLDQVVDFVAQRGVLFFLLVDGSVMRCDQVSPTEPLSCAPAPYRNVPPEGGETATLPAWRPVRLDVSVVQEPTLFMLESEGKAVLILSFQLAYHHQLRATEPLPGPITAFRVSTEQSPAGERWLYAAAGEQIYRAPVR